MTQYLSSLLSSYSADFISNAFLVLMIVILVAALIFRSVNRFQGLTSYAPTLLTSLGILGTFSGILVGLMGFEPKNIDGSIEFLLNGLKTAFFTSLIGMTASIFFKIADGIFPHPVEKSASSVGPEDIYSIMNQQVAHSNTLINAIKGDEDASLISQIRNLRTDINDGNRNIIEQFRHISKKNNEFHDVLWRKMDEFGELLSKSATEQVIYALKEVIVEFNDKLTEQFGDNFKRLDESVKSLVEWQENYRHQLEEMKNQYQLGVDAITLTEKSVENISTQTKIIPETMEQLQKVLLTGRDQIIELEVRLKAFSDLRDKAVEAMPEIRLQLDKTMEVIQSSVQSASTHYDEMLKESQQMMQGFTETHESSLQSFKENLESSSQKVATQLTNVADTLSEELELVTVKFENSIQSAAENMNKIASDIGTSADYTREKLEDSMTKIDAELRYLVTSIKSDSQETHSILQQSNSELLSNTKEIQLETKVALEKFQDRLETTLEDIFKVQAQAVRKTFDSLEEQISSAVGQTGAAVEKQVEVLDSQMQEEIQRTVTVMGEALATVTQQFTRDYSSLVREMGKVVNSRVTV